MLAFSSHVLPCCVLSVLFMCLCLSPLAVVRQAGCGDRCKLKTQLLSLVGRGINTKNRANQTNWKQSRESHYYEGRHNNELRKTEVDLGNRTQ